MYRYDEEGLTRADSSDSDKESIDLEKMLKKKPRVSVKSEQKICWFLFLLMCVRFACSYLLKRLNQWMRLKKIREP